MTQSQNLRIELPYLPPDSYSPNNRGSWAEKRGRKGDNNRVSEDVWALVIEAGWDGEPLKAARCWMTFHIPTRHKRDPDNMVAKTKPIWDALVKAGVLADDTIDVIGWPTYGHIYSKPAKTVVEIDRTHTHMPVQAPRW